MAPMLVVYTIYYVLCFLFVTTNCSYVSCSSKECRKRTACPLSCSCLGYLVDCAKRNLDKIPDDIPTWVEILDLQNNKITFIDDATLQDLKNLTELDLSQNRLQDVNSSTLRQLGSLQKLNIASNKLTEIPNFNHVNLTALLLQRNEIHNLNTSLLEKFTNLQKLDLSFNNLIDISEDTFGYSTSLLHLSLSHNKIVYIERGAFDNLTTLMSLKLNRNKLSSIPKELFRHLSNLNHLEINSNSLTTIEGLSFQGLVSLVVLKLRHSGIAHLLDGAFYGLNSIKKLQLDYNQLSKVTKGWLYGLNSLQRLYLNHNNISMIEDDAWDSGKRLLELDISYNKLEYVSSKTFDKLYPLKRLILSNNKITYIEEGSFRSLSALQYLDLKNNELSWTIEDSDDLFAGLERLRYLDLANNQIKSVKAAFSSLVRLERLNLTGNSITTIEQNAFDKLPQLHELLINTSSLLCDCNLSWMAQNIYNFPIIAKCDYPDSMKGLSIFKFKPKDFICEGLPKPIIVKEPITKITLKGENVTLECQAKSNGNSEIQFHWRKDGKLLPNMRLWSKNTNTKLGNYTLHASFLFIENIQDKDEGRYQCVVSNHFGSVYSSKARITVHVYPVFTKTPVDVAIKSGSTARLECGAKGQPQPDIAWKKDGGGEDFPAARERRMHVMLPTDDIFFIVNVKASDTGVYSCTAQNVAGTITANATLTVLETPTFVKKMENKEAKLGETVVLECRASGNPKPKLSWIKDGVPLVITDRHFFPGDNQLLVIDMTKYTDSGEYTCEMSNTLGTERGTSHLKILPANVSDDNNMTGIIVIAVVVCIVGTSIVWVIVIHRTRKPREDFVTSARSGRTSPAEIAPFTPYRTVCPTELRQSVTNMFLDSHSGHSKDSGTGDSAQPSNDDLLIEGDDHGLLLDICTAKRSGGGVPQISSLMTLQDGVGNSQTETYTSSNSSVSKEQVPLLHSFRTSHSVWKNNRKSLAEFRQHPHAVDWYTISCGDTTWPCTMVQRSMSADQVNCSDVSMHHRGCSEPPQNLIVPRVDSDGVERDSGFSTFPRSVTQVSVSHWNSESPKLHRFPKDVPNDSGSFSIASEDVQILTNPAKCINNSMQPITPRTLKSTALDQKNIAVSI